METTSSINPPVSSSTIPPALPLSLHAGYPAFLSEHSGEPGILLTEAVGSLAPLRPIDRFTQPHRDALADAVLNGLRRWNAPAAALAAAEVLRDPRSYAVVTGQQAGMAGGPLYTLYKAIGAVRAAEELARAYPEHRFVPVFWIEGDDHDFDEARKIPLLDRSGNTRTVAYDDGDARLLHVGDRRASAEGLAALQSELREVLPPTEFSDEALRIMSECYGGNGATLADGFARCLYAVLGETPLVVAGSRDPGLKSLAADIFEKEVEEPGRVFAAVGRATDDLAARGLPTPITPKPGALFITHEDERRSLVPDGDGYLIKGTQERMSREDALRIAREHPERLSPNVVLRPIVQDAIFPTAIYLGGPSEIAYLRQILPAYDVFGMGAPAVGPRPFVLILEPKVRRVLEGGARSLEMLVAEEFDAATLVVDGETVKELETAGERAIEGLRAAFAEMQAITRRIDPTLEKTLGSAEAGAGKGIEDLTKRLHSALKKKQQTEIDRLNGVRSMLMPGGAPQERGLNALYFIAKYGPVRFRETLEKITMETGMVQVVEV